jgi:hypothetical protein
MLTERGVGVTPTKDTMCTLTLTKDKAKLENKDLPVQIVKPMYYKQSESIMYQLCCKEGVLKGTYGRNELNPQPHLNPELMGINYQKMKQKDKKKTQMIILSACHASVFTRQVHHHTTSSPEGLGFLIMINLKLRNNK